MIDGDIIESCRNGDLSGFRELVNRVSPYAFSVAFRMTGDKAVAEDIVQETMIVLWKSIRNLKSPDVFKAWLYRITINKCYDELRRRKNNPELRADDITWGKISEKVQYNPGVQLENKEIAELIGTLTCRLSSKQKAVFILSDLEGMNSNEISEITGMNRSRIKANLFHARKNIGINLEKYL